MNTKLTLSVNESTVKRAKKYAREKGTSLSKIVERHLDQLQRLQKPRRKKSVVDRLHGIIKGVPDNVDYKDLIADAIMEKYMK